MRTIVLTLVLCLLISYPSGAYDVPTHLELGRRAAIVAALVEERLSADLGMPIGRESQLQADALRFSVADWIRFGAGEEDRPFWRVRHHFHNPFLPWESAGLRLDTNPGVVLGASSVLRAQQSFQ